MYWLLIAAGGVALLLVVWSLRRSLMTRASFDIKELDDLPDETEPSKSRPISVHVYTQAASRAQVMWTRNSPQDSEFRRMIARLDAESLWEFNRKLRDRQMPTAATHVYETLDALFVRLGPPSDGLPQPGVEGDPR